MGGRAGWPDIVGQELALFRLARTHATQAAVEAVDLMYTAGGGSAVYVHNRLHAPSATSTLSLSNFDGAGQLRGFRPDIAGLVAGPPSLSTIKLGAGAVPTARARDSLSTRESVYRVSG